MENRGLHSIKKIYPRTLPEMAVSIIREEILSGNLSGGTQLKQEEWASQLNISLSALREALKSLEGEGLVTFIANRGAIVSELSVEEAKEIYEIRIFLETGAIELAIPYLVKQDIIAAQAILEQAEDVTNSNKWGELNWKFHETLYKAASKPKLLSLIKNMYNNVERYMRLYFSDISHQQVAKREHRELLEACKQKEVLLAKEILTKHIADTSSVVTDHLRKFKG